LIETGFGGAASVVAVVPVVVPEPPAVVVDVDVEVDVDVLPDLLPPPCDVDAPVVVGLFEPADADLPEPGSVVGLPDPVDVAGPCELCPPLAAVVTCGLLAAPAPLPCADAVVAVIAIAVTTVRNGNLFIVEPLRR
jgi:hypothetical protein